MSTYITPGGIAAGIYLNMLEQPHLLIAGATGSGKSVIINGLIYTLLFQGPAQNRLILIDPKRVELIDYRYLPHTAGYASEPGQIITVLNQTVDLLERRFIDMQNRRIKKYDGSDVYIFIDEYADLITTSKKYVLPDLIRIAQLGRAAKIHLFIATQRPTKDIINGQIKVNIDSRIALRCPTGQDSRNIINVKGAENLPRFGKGFYLTPETMIPVMVDIPYIEPEKQLSMINWWMSQTRTPDKPKRRIFSLFRKTG